jgi:hypothetical protein
LQFETDLPLESDELRAVAKPFDSRYTRQTVSFPYGLFVPGINLSTLVVQRAFRGLRPTPMMLTVLNWAYLALFIGIDRSLLATVEHDALAEEESLDDLQTKADAMFVIYSDVRKARARLDSVLNDLGGGELALWQAIADVQKFGELLAAVDTKVELLQRISERRVAKAAAESAQRTRTFLGSLTALTVVTVVIAVLGGLGGTPDNAIGLVWRLLTVVIASVIAFGLFMAARGRRARKRRLAAMLHHRRLAGLLRYRRKGLANTG